MFHNSFKKKQPCKCAAYVDCRMTRIPLDPFHPPPFILLTASLSHPDISTALHESFIVFFPPLFCLLFSLLRSLLWPDFNAWRKTDDIDIWRVAGKGQGAGDEGVFTTETGLTALMALEDDVLDGQHAALPGGHRFKDDLRRKEKAHKHSDKWTRSQNATCRSPTGFEKVRLYTTARED